MGVSGKSHLHSERRMMGTFPAGPASSDNHALRLPGLKAYGWYPSFCHWTNRASSVAVQYGPPGGMEGGSPS